MHEVTADIVVLGSGIAGYAAAMAAAETHSVIVVDKAAAPGGATTHTNVGTLCGLYFQGEQPKPIPHGFCLEFTEALKEADEHAKVLSLPDGLHVITYEWSNLQKLFSNQLTQSKNIQLLLNHELTDIVTEDQSITKLITRDKAGEKVIACKRVIDCTGTGYAAGLLNHPMLTESSYQSAAQVIRLNGVNTTTEYALNLAIRKVMLKNRDQRAWPSGYVMLSVVPGSLRQNRVDLKIPLTTVITDSQNQKTDLQHEVDQHLSTIVHALHEVESLAGATLETVFPTPGIRIQQRPQGQHILTGTEIINSTKFPDAIALGTWPIEEWNYAGKVTMSYLKNNETYDIPARSLMSPVYNNLFFAGKGISADAKAIASARVTGTCLQTGYAAGKLATCESTLDYQNMIQQIQRTWKV